VPAFIVIYIRSIAHLPLQKAKILFVTIIGALVALLIYLFFEAPSNFRQLVVLQKYAIHLNKVHNHIDLFVKK